MPVAVEIEYQLLRAKRKTDRSPMPMCIAMLQNQAKNMMCQNVNLTWPAIGAPPGSISFRAAHVPPMDVTPYSRRPMTPNARKRRIIHGAA
jgi:hypothetical protein